jgi:hypothetical protein
VTRPLALLAVLATRGTVLITACLIVMIGSSSAAAAPPASCDLRLTVELMPEVPNPGDTGFLSSLLGNHSGYQLILERQRSNFVIDLELSGPGPSYRCGDVIEAMRRDARVVFVKVQHQQRS